jgi:hypothetical protein
VSAIERDPKSRRPKTSRRGLTISSLDRSRLVL